MGLTPIPVRDVRWYPPHHMNDCNMETESAGTRVLIVDDHYIVRRGLTELLESGTRFTVGAVVGDASQALEAARRTPFDLAIVDISLGDMDGIELTRRLKCEHPDLIVLILSMHEEQLYADRARRAGASGFVAKQEAGETLLEAMAEVLQGRPHFHQKQ